MGYASYLENIIDRLQASVGRLEKTKRSKSHYQSKSTYPPSSENTDAVIKEAQNVLDTLKNLVELATSPELILADEVKILRAQNEQLKDRIVALEREAQLSSERSEQAKLVLQRAKNEIIDLEEERNRLVAQKAKLTVNFEQQSKQQKKLEKEVAQLQRRR